LRQIAAHPAGDSGGPRKLARADQNFAGRERLEPTVVIDVQVVMTTRLTSPEPMPIARNCGPASSSGSMSKRTALRK
jgi:hypothetical protein